MTLPFNFNKLPSALPPPANCSAADVEAVVSSARAVGEYIQSTDETVRTAWKEWVEAQRCKEVEEKRRIAPGYLDTGFKMLQPVRKAEEAARPASDAAGSSEKDEAQVNEIDKAFGGVSLS